MTEREKVTVEEVIGLIHTDETTDSVEEVRKLRGRENMTEKRFTTNGYKIYDTFHDGMHWLVNEVEAEEIVEIMNNLDTKARERSKALSKLQKENEQLKKQIDNMAFILRQNGLGLMEDDD